MKVPAIAALMIVGVLALRRGGRRGRTPYLAERLRETQSSEEQHRYKHTVALGRRFEQPAHLVLAEEAACGTAPMLGAFAVGPQVAGFAAAWPPSVAYANTPRSAVHRARPQGASPCHCTNSPALSS
jgi:hypothetical protein